MKIIDAHLHYCPGEPYFDGIAGNAGHENTGEHLKARYGELEIAHGIVMGNREPDPASHQYPDFLSYCVGIDGFYLKDHKLEDSMDLIEENLRMDQCVGIKLYPGYYPLYVHDKAYEPVYELAQAYRKPVAVHMGATAGSNALLKYSHPLTLDEAAVRHPKVQFIMCHFGNPFLMDAAAVLDKNENVAADLSGLLEGRIGIPEFYREQKGYVEALRTWIGYVSQYDKFLFGTDWPLVNLEEYIGFIRYLLPEKAYEDVFYNNAVRVYGIQPPSGA